jgi:hypothetical protein
VIRFTASGSGDSVNVVLVVDRLDVGKLLAGEDLAVDLRQMLPMFPIDRPVQLVVHYAHDAAEAGRTLLMQAIESGGQVNVEGVEPPAGSKPS